MTFFRFLHLLFGNHVLDSVAVVPWRRGPVVSGNAQVHSSGGSRAPSHLRCRCEPAAWQLGRDARPPPAAASFTFWVQSPRSLSTGCSGRSGHGAYYLRGAGLRWRQVGAMNACTTAMWPRAVETSVPGLPPPRRPLLLPVPSGARFCSCPRAEQFLGCGAPPWTGAAAQRRLAGRPRGPHARVR